MSLSLDLYSWYNSTPFTFSTAGEDYVGHINTPLVFASGSTAGAQVCEDIVIVEDNKLEDDEQFTYSLTSNDPVVFLASGGTVTIEDNEDNDSEFSYSFEFQ